MAAGWMERERKGKIVVPLVASHKTSFVVAVWKGEEEKMTTKDVDVDNEQLLEFHSG